MIYTVTMNPSVEFVTEISKFNIDKDNLSENDMMIPAGTGINISRILKQLGLPSIATGFSGGYTGEFVEDWLKREDINTQFIKIDDNTRINIKITGVTSSFIESKGPNISNQELQELLYYLSRVKEGDTLFLSTSFPRNITETVIERMIAISKANKANFVIDIDKYYLEKFLYEPSLLASVSVKCLEHLFKTKINTEEDLLELKDDIFQFKSKFTVVPFVEGFVYLFADGKIYSFKTENIPNQKKELFVDSIIAGFVGTFIRTSDCSKSFKMANAVASASSKTKDLAKKYLIEECLENSKIKKIQ